ncbi:site-specific recombinase phage integrase family protein [Neiella marina]|uniref:Site-specific recombinase phage integrase family protein n=1 Tax=Neiella marina TaxID=508461 RepID=A0A8J2U2K5_9GAMM|nr:phage integrase SAM-like domain-containing protein [Neiella marina]GGA67237.1 site-specific recombinase phage integrase family protein [Neiella marina]
MANQLDRHDISDELYVYLQDNSKRWYARIKVAGKWYSKTTKQKEKEKAIAMAYRLQMELEILSEKNQLVKSKRFRDVAEKAIASMQQAIDDGVGKQIYRNYIQVLNKYHIPFFDRIYVTSIDITKLKEFNTWRIAQMKRVPAKSTLLNHNAAMQMVFKEAIENKWMLANQVPDLNTSEGEAPQRRAHFTPQEYEQVMDSLYDMMENSHKEVTRHIRQLTEDYAEFVIYTGMRPGSELDNLTWGDLHIERHGDKATFHISVRKGKTTLYTGTREIVCKKALEMTVRHMVNRFPNRKASDKLFTLPDGSTTSRIGRSFAEAVKKAGLEKSPSGNRTLYSLRHSYITWELIAQTVPIEVLARQCGTSTEMIERHYSHVIPRMYTKELSGVDLPAKEEIEKKWTKHKQAIGDKWVETYKTWEANYKQRGCI